MDPIRSLIDILRLDRKTTSYKLALLRSINDFFYERRTEVPQNDLIAVSLEDLARYWVAYYWPFMDPTNPIQQGMRTARYGILTQDIAFRASLTTLKEKYGEMPENSGRDRGSFGGWTEPADPGILPYFNHALKDIQKAIHMPIRYSGQGEWSVFSKPQKISAIDPGVSFVSYPKPEQYYLWIGFDLYQAFKDLSYLLEAICVHEWCIYTQNSNPRQWSHAELNSIYRLFSSRPGNRLPDTWDLLCTELENEEDNLKQTTLHYTVPMEAPDQRSNRLKETYLSSDESYLTQSFTKSVLIESRQRKVFSAIDTELKAHGRPLHYSIIAKIVIDRYPELETSERQILFSLKKQPEMFACVNDGIYKIV